MDVLATILSSSRTVFTPQWLAMTDSTRDKESLSRSLRYYARTGALRNPRGGIYTKPVYDEKEMACTLFRPSYISLEYVLARAGVTFQYSPCRIVRPKISVITMQMIENRADRR